jgi:hypothetical protein
MFLLKLLLQHGKTVLYESAKEGWITAFIPNDHTPPAHTIAAPHTPTGTTTAPPATPAAMHRYRCYHAYGDWFRARGGIYTLVNRRSIVFLYDPPQQAVELREMDCVVVVTASPDLTHFHRFGLGARVYKINMFTEEEVHAFFDIVRPENAPRSEPVRAGAVADNTFATPAGPVLTPQRCWPLGEEHLRCGYYEVCITAMISIVLVPSSRERAAVHGVTGYCS